MKNYKYLLYSILAVFLLGCLSTASAGWFDFADSNMTEHDFGNFTMNVPKNATFEEMLQPNGEDRIDELADKFGGSISIDYDDQKWADSEYAEYFHTLYSYGEDDGYIGIEYLNAEEDKIESSKIIDELYSDNTLEENKDEYTIYYWNSFNQYVVKKENEDDGSVVILRSSDKDLIIQMAESIKFK